MTDVDSIPDPKKRSEERLKFFANTAIGIIADQDAIEEYVLEGGGKKSLSGLNEDEIDFLKRLIDALR